MLDGADAETPMNPDETALMDGKVEYTFTWDGNIADADENAKYTVSLTGLDAEGNRVLIDLGDAYTGGKSLTVDASDWSYQKVELKVTRIGDTSGATKQIGLSTTGTYQLKQRLTQPGQPSIENVDVNEFDYQLTWAAISDEKGCSGYQAYIRLYDDEDQLGEAESLFSQPITTDQKTDGTYQERLTLKEEWAGKKAVVYLVAKASADSSYLDSADGIYYELTIPNRIKTPEVSWKYSWEAGQEKAVSADTFRNRLAVYLTGDTPPGGSAYLLKGYIYTSADDANAAKNAGTPAQSAIATYPATEDDADIIPVQMDASGGSYEHTLDGLSIQYAGKYVIFYTRISSGAGQLSSEWVASDPVPLPWVQLETPAAVSESIEETLEATITGDNPDFPEEEKEEEWIVTNRAVSWDAVECADAYEVQVTTCDDETFTYHVTADDGILSTEDDGWKITIEHAAYTDANGDQHSYSLESSVSLTTETQEDGTITGYTLHLPDIEHLYPDADKSVEVTNDAFLKTKTVTVKAAAEEDKAYTESEESSVTWE